MPQRLPPPTTRVPLPPPSSGEEEREVEGQGALPRQQHRPPLLPGYTIAPGPVYHPSCPAGALRGYGKGGMPINRPRLVQIRPPKSMAMAVSLG